MRFRWGVRVRGGGGILELRYCVREEEVRGPLFSQYHHLPLENTVISNLANPCGIRGGMRGFVA